MLSIEFFTVNHAIDPFKCFLRAHAENVLTKKLAMSMYLREYIPQRAQISREELFVVIDLGKENIHGKLIYNIWVWFPSHIHVIQIHQGLSKVWSYLLRVCYYKEYFLEQMNIFETFRDAIVYNIVIVLF